MELFSVIKICDPAVELFYQQGTVENEKNFQQAVDHPGRKVEDGAGGRDAPETGEKTAVHRQIPFPKLQDDS